MLVASCAIALGITVVDTGRSNNVILYVVTESALTSGDIGKSAITAHLFGITVSGTGRILNYGAVVVSKSGSVFLLGCLTAGALIYVNTGGLASSNGRCRAVLYPVVTGSVLADHIANAAA